jgi:chemosensory pili system protein ChpA (sensor histidine kinase/response regulator)
MRQLTQELQKNAELEIKGGQNEIDRAILERLIVPLEHLLRNSLDHGVEPPEVRVKEGKPEHAAITIDVAHISGEILIKFSDDGRGINREKLRDKVRARGEDPDQYDDAALINVIFDAGFSTAEKVTAISGRGIGLDIVRNDILSMGGRVDVSSEEGKGTTFLLYLPLTVSVIQAMLVKTANGRSWALPASMVEQIEHVSEEDLAKMYQDGRTEWQGRKYPFFNFDALVDQHFTENESYRYNAVAFIRAGKEVVAVHVAQVSGNQEIVIKSAGTQLLRRVNGLVGATILGTGEIVLIVNPVQLARRRAAQEASRRAREKALALQAAAEAPVSVEALEEKEASKTVLVVDDSLTVRKVTSRFLTREGFNVETAKDGFDALKQLSEHHPDIILLDIEMPKMDGFEFAKLVKGDDATKSIPIIMITSRTADKHRQRARELGVNGYLGKPYQEDELLGHIKELIDNPKAVML